MHVSGRRAIGTRGDDSHEDVDETGASGAAVPAAWRLHFRRWERWLRPPIPCARMSSSRRNGNATGCECRRHEGMRCYRRQLLSLEERGVLAEPCELCAQASEVPDEVRRRLVDRTVRHHPGRRRVREPQRLRIVAVRMDFEQRVALIRAYVMTGPCELRSRRAFSTVAIGVARHRWAQPARIGLRR